MHWTMHALSRAQNWLWLYGTFMETMEAKQVNSNLNKQNTEEKKTKLERNQEDKISAWRLPPYLFTDLFNSVSTLCSPNSPFVMANSKNIKIQTCICLYRTQLFVGPIQESDTIMVLHTRKAGQKHKEWNITMKSSWPRSQSQFIQFSYCSQELQKSGLTSYLGGEKADTTEEPLCGSC